MNENSSPPRNEPRSSASQPQSRHRRRRFPSRQPIPGNQHQLPQVKVQGQQGASGNGGDRKEGSEPSGPPSVSRPRSFMNNRGNTDRSGNRERGDRGRDHRDQPRHRQDAPMQGRPPRQHQGGTADHRSQAPSPNNNREVMGEQQEVIRRYDQLLAQALKARHQYFEQHCRVSFQQEDHLEQQWHRANQELIRYQKSLRPQQLKDLEQARTALYPSDDQYSSSRQDELIEFEKIQRALQQPSQPVEMPVAPHISDKQKNRDSFKGDQEESIGSMEDYFSYKKSSEGVS